MRYNGGVRLHACAAVVLVAFGLAACGGDDNVEGPAWNGPPDPDPSGVVSVDGFQSLQDDVDERWERSAAMSAAEFVRLDERRAARTTVEGMSSAEGGGPQTVVVLLDGLLDDSVRAERWTLAFVEDDGTFRLTAALREQRCQRDRGHQDFSPDACL